MTVELSTQDKVAIVTGGGGGIGSAISRRLADAGVKVVVTYNSNEARAQQVVDALPGQDHMVAHAPVEESVFLDALADQVLDRYGRLDLLVNNAGVTKPVAHADSGRFR